MPQEVKDTRKYSLGTLLMLLPLAVMAAYYYGERALRMILLSALTAVIAEYVGSIFVRKKATLADFNAVCIGVMIPLLLPASSPLWLPMVGVIFAIVVVKLPFGNARSLMFEPVSAAIAFLTICSKAYVFGYPAVDVIKAENVILQSDFTPGTSLAAMLYQNNSIGTNLISMLDLMIGSFVGPMGATCGFALLAVLISMLFGRREELYATFSFLGVTIIYAFAFPRVLTGRLVSVAMELSAGMLVFAAIFLITNPAILPKTKKGKIAFGLFAGIMCMLIRTFGVFEEGVCFAVLIADALCEQFDKIGLPSFLKKKEPEKAPLSDEEFERITDSSFIDVGEAPSGGAVNG